MSARSRHSARVGELIQQNVPFVEATVVRAQCPTSARPGDAAVVLADGTIEGFIGGQCAEGSVRAAALDLIESGEALLLRILPEAEGAAPDADGAMTVVNPCLSGGAVEVFLEPKLPATRVGIFGATPIAEALAVLTGQLGFAVVSDGGAVPDFGGCAAVIISSHGRSEDEALTSALEAGVGFIGLVASTKRGTAVVDALDVSPEDRKRIHTPVGLDIGATTAEEIALSILADIVRAVRREGLVAAAVSKPVAPETAVDPICAMTVVIGPDTPHLTVDGIDFWYCNPGCRTRHAEDTATAL